MTCDANVVCTPSWSVVLQNCVSGDEIYVAVPENGTLRDLQNAIYVSTGMPPFEQVLLDQEMDDITNMGRCDDLKKLADISPAIAEGEGFLRFARRDDPRPRSEKNCAFLGALREHKLQDAMAVLDSSGVAVDPDCAYNFVSELACFCGGGRDFLDISRSTMPALCLAIWTRCTWTAGGKVSGEAVPEDVVLPVVARLLEMGADVKAVQSDTLTKGSWGSEQCNRTALQLAVQTRSPAIADLLQQAGACSLRSLRLMKKAGA